MNKVLWLVLVSISSLLISCSKNGDSQNALGGAAPEAPFELQAVVSRLTASISLTWKHSLSNVSQFKVVRTDGQNNEVSFVTSGSSLSMVLSNVPTGISFQYCVKAVNEFGESACSNLQSILVLALPTAPPAVPAGVAATAIATDQIRVTWNDVSEEDGYLVERSSDNVNFAPIASLAANSIAYVSTALNFETLYYYRVRSFNLAGPSEPSTTVSATTFTPPATAAPDAPSNFAVTALSDKTVSFTWVDNSRGVKQETKFEIEEFSSASNSFEKVLEPAMNTMTIQLGNRVGLSSYRFRMRAVNVIGASNYSSEASITMPPDLGAKPVAPSNLAAMSLLGNKIRLTWMDNANNENGFHVYRAVGAGNFELRETLAANSVSFEEAISQDGNLRYKVSAFSATGGDSDLSNEVMVVFTVQPNAPSNLVAVPDSHKQISLSWKDESDNEGAFVIEKSEDNVTFVALPERPANSTAFSVQGLDGAKPYYFRVRATRSGVSSGFSNVANATTKAFPAIPQAPSDFLVLRKTYQEVVFRWMNNSQGVDRFNIYRKKDGDAAFVKIASISIIQYSDLDVQPSTTYIYQVGAENDAGEAKSSDLVVTTTKMPPTIAPTLALSAMAQLSLSLSWTDSNPDIDGFKIYRTSPGGGTAYTQVAVVAADARSFQDSGLLQDTVYGYFVEAFNNGGMVQSAMVNARTLRVPPAAPSGLVAMPASDSSIGLEWVDNSNNEDRFDILMMGGDGNYAKVAQVAADVRIYFMQGLLPNTSYSFKVKAVNNGGESVASVAASAKTIVGSPAGAPSGLIARASVNNNFNLTWVDNSNSEASFKLCRMAISATVCPSTAMSCEPSSFPACEPEITIAADTQSYTDTASLVGGAWYAYKMRAVNAGGMSAYSNVAIVRNPNKIPAIPVISAVQPASNRLVVSWSAVAAPVTSYLVEVSTVNTFASLVSSQSVASSGRSAVFGGLVPNTGYFVRMKAINADVASNYSAIVAATTLNTVPTAPSAPVATAVSSTSIRFAWQDNSNNEADFLIYAKRYGAANYTQLAAAPANSTSFVAVGLLPNTQYAFYVQARNNGGVSAATAVVSEHTFPAAPAAPTSLALVSRTDDTVSLKWVMAVPAAAVPASPYPSIGGFRIERSMDNGATYQQVGSVVASARSFTDVTGVMANKSYLYRVYGFNRGGDSNFSNSLSVMTLPAAPGTPTNLVAVVQSGKVMVSWQDNSGNELGFAIERGASVNGDNCVGVTYAALANVATNVVSYLDAPAAGAYCYRVKAKNSGGSDPYSNTGYVKLP